MDYGVEMTIVKQIVSIIVRNILECIGKHSFSYEYKRMCTLSKYSYLKKIYLIINNDYKSMVFTKLRGMIETFSNANARVVRIVHTMSWISWAFCSL